jgi:carbon storage regulator
MLVLSRKIGERLVVPSCEMTITVIAIQGNKVRLGIAAPDDVQVHREEVWHRVPEPEAKLPDRVKRLPR